MPGQFLDSAPDTLPSLSASSSSICPHLAHLVALLIAAGILQLLLLPFALLMRKLRRTRQRPNLDSSWILNRQTRNRPPVQRHSRFHCLTLRSWQDPRRPVPRIEALPSTGECERRQALHSTSPQRPASIPPPKRQPIGSKM